VFKNGVIEGAYAVANCLGSTLYNVTAKDLHQIMYAGGGCTVVHNTFTQRTRGDKSYYSFGILQNAGAPGIFKNNLIFGFDSDTASYQYLFINDGNWNNILMSGPHSNVVGNVCDYRQHGCTFAPADSCFVVDAAGGDFRLCPNSPAIGAGVADADVLAMTPDQAGVARSSQRRDAGALSVRGTVSVATALAFRQQPRTVAVGQSLTPAVAVAVVDSAGQTVPTSTAPITLTLKANPGSATLAGVTTVPAVAGVATFDVSVSKVANQYTLEASSPGLPSVTSRPFNVTSPPPPRHPPYRWGRGRRGAADQGL
jgi:hypothetical protein